jgi:hypothetical protein
LFRRRVLRGGTLTAVVASVCIAAVKIALLFASLAFAASSCTTLENRRDLYRSPAEGYERWYRQPPPTRLPASAPENQKHATAETRERNGVITFPEESTLPERGQ